MNISIYKHNILSHKRSSPQKYSNGNPFILKIAFRYVLLKKYLYLYIFIVAIYYINIEGYINESFYKTTIDCSYL